METLQGNAWFWKQMLIATFNQYEAFSNHRPCYTTSLGLRDNKMWNRFAISNIKMLGVYSAKDKVSEIVD